MSRRWSIPEIRLVLGLIYSIHGFSWSAMSLIATSLLSLCVVWICKHYFFPEIILATTCTYSSRKSFCKEGKMEP